MLNLIERRRIGFREAPSTLICVALGFVVLGLSGCATLPTSGPTLHDVRKEAVSGRGIVPFKLVPLDDTVVAEASSPNPGIAKLAALAQGSAIERADLIRPGDTLNIAVFEVGISLFQGGSTATGVAAAPRTPTAATQILTPIVREDGFIDLPYLGRLRAAGAYPEELAEVVRRRLKAVSENPEVSVGIVESVRNVVYLGGAIAKSGRYRLTAAREHLLDAIALAGGSLVDPNELEVKLQRGAQIVSAPLNRISPGDPADLPVHPGDRIQLVRVRPSYTVFGASEKVSQIYFDARDVSLAEAIARAAGPSDNRANPRGVLVCRYVAGPDGELKPIVYQLNMMKAGSYFLAQKFQMRDKDVILFANSSGTLTQKMVTLIGTLFGPVAAIRFAAQ